MAIPMAGVLTCPLSATEKLYADDFRLITAGRLAHPYTNVSNASGSTPFNLLTGTAYTPSAYKAGMVSSEYNRQYNSSAWTAYMHPRAKWASGGRVEQLAKLN